MPRLPFILLHDAGRLAGVVHSNPIYEQMAQLTFFGQLSHFSFSQINPYPLSAHSQSDHSVPEMESSLPSRAYGHTPDICIATGRILPW